jgi:hypothetical protein
VLFLDEHDTKVFQPVQHRRGGANPGEQNRLLIITQRKRQGCETEGTNEHVDPDKNWQGHHAGGMQ